MKKLILTAGLFGAIVLSASAQQRKTVSMVRNTGTSVGVHAGANMFTINGKDVAGNELNYKLNTGFSAGLNVELPLGGGAYLQPGVDFTQKGAELPNNVKLKLNYIDIPLNFIYKPVLGTGNLVLGFGPYIGFGVGGNLKTNSGTEMDVVFRDEFDITAPSLAQFRKTDAGANFLAGYEFANNLSLNLKAQLGLKDIDPDLGTSNQNNPTRFRNTGFGLSLGYRF